MNLLGTFLELDKLYESANWTDRDTLIKDIKAAGKNYDFDKYSDAQLYRMWERIQGEAIIHNQLKTEPEVPQKRCEYCGELLNPLGQCPICDLGEDDLREAKAACKDWTNLLTEAAELSMDHAVNSVVDQVKAVYEAGLFTKLPVGRENAFTLEICGPDKERLTGYFQKQPEFNYEINNDQGIISHEFISNEYDVEIFDSFISMYKIPQNESLKEWKDASGNVVTTSPAAPSTNPPASQPLQVTQATNAANIVTIVYDSAKGKLRAQADDGIHGKANVAFPNNLRNQPGQQYEVETLIWNGKNYRASGKITAINSVSNTATTINENLFKETNEMNFQTILEELDRLYEETQRIAFIDSTGSHTKETEAKYSERAAADGFKDIRIITDSSMKELADCVKAGNDVTLYTDDDDYKYNTDVADMKNFNAVILSNLQEDAEVDDAEILIDDEPITDDEAAEVAEDAVVEEEIPAQLILECSKCGGIIIKDEADVEVDDETDLANVKEKCKYCEETEGYKIIGAVAPYEGVVVAEEEEPEVTEALTEGKIKDSLLKLGTRLGADGATIVRSFAELISDLIKNDALLDAAEHVENKAVLKALENGNEKVLNTCTIEDIEEIKQDIEEYKKAKADKKASNDEEELDEFLDVKVDARGFGGTGNDVSVL